MKNNKSIYIVGIFMLITMVSIGYAILTGQLNINGSAKVKAASWDIYFTNIKIKDGSVTASVKPSITDKTTVNFEVELSKPGDFYEFNVDVVNDGDLDAMIESISITPELTTDQQKYLSYSVTYLDDVPLEVKDILHAKKVRTLKVKTEYLKSVENSELNQNDETINIKATIKYVQADNTAKTPTSQEKNIDKEPPVIENVSSNVITATKDTEVIVTFEANDENEIIDTLTENDIQVKVGGKTVTPTTKTLISSGINSVTYNLSMTGLTGNGELTLEIDSSKIIDESGNQGDVVKITPGVTVTSAVSVVSGNGYNVGNELAIGNEHFYVMKNDGINVTMISKYNLNAADPYNSSMTYKQNSNQTLSAVKFSSTNYWGNVSDGTYIYDDRADISLYVNNYKSYLEDIGVDIIEARLISYDELVELGCNKNGGDKACQSAPAWLGKIISFWTGSATNENYVKGLNALGSDLTNYYYSSAYLGVRPVIVIPVDAI